MDPLHVHQPKVRAVLLRLKTRHAPVEVALGECLVASTGSEPAIPAEDPPQDGWRQLGQIPRGPGSGGAAAATHDKRNRLRGPGRDCDAVERTVPAAVRGIILAEEESRGFQRLIG